VRGSVSRTRARGVAGKCAQRGCAGIRGRGIADADTDVFIGGYPEIEDATKDFDASPSSTAPQPSEAEDMEGLRGRLRIRQSPSPSEAAHGRCDWPAAWVAARVAQHISIRPFLDGEDAPWVRERRYQLEGIYLRSLELAANASLQIGGAELNTAERSARSLVHRAPFHESGYRCLMEALAAQGNHAEALQIYDQLRTLLRDELGAAPSPATQALHRRLLD